MIFNRGNKKSMRLLRVLVYLKKLYFLSLLISTMNSNISIDSIKINLIDNIIDDTIKIYHNVILSHI